MVRYIVTTADDSGRVKYGIAAMSGTKYADMLEDIVPSLEETIHLAALLQENGVAAEHFHDVVEDYLAGCRIPGLVQ